MTKDKLLQDKKKEQFINYPTDKTLLFDWTVFMFFSSSITNHFVSTATIFTVLTEKSHDLGLFWQ